MRTCNTIMRLFALASVSCALETGGVEHLGPTNWLAFVQCGKDDAPQLLQLEEPTDVSDGWTCAPQKPTEQSGRVLCWNGDAEVMLVAQCFDRSYKSQAYFAKCHVWLTCEGNAA